MPLISVIMPSYNHASYISEAIESVLGQTIQDIELIIIDDASADGSRGIIEEFSRKDNRINTSFHEINLGIARTYNEGLDRAQGTFLAFISSDDIWMPNKLEKQLEVLSRDENLVVWSEGLIIDGAGSSTGELFTHVHQASHKKKNGDLFEELMLGNYIFGSSFIVKRENLRGIRFNERMEYLNDFQFYIDLSRLYQYRFISEPLAKYRIHGKNTISANIEGHYYDYPVLVEHIFREYGDKIPNSARLELFLASVDRLVKIISRRESKIKEIEEYADSFKAGVKQKDDVIRELNSHIQQLTELVRSLENTSQLKDSTIGQLHAHAHQQSEYILSLEELQHQTKSSIQNLDAQIQQVTRQAESLEDALHRKDAVIDGLNSKVQQVTEYSRLLENQIKIMKGSFITWLKMRKQP